jgi:predicted MFS family arabinose efflux permease
LLLILCSDLLSTWGYSQVLALLNFHLIARGHDLPAIGKLNAIILMSSFISSLPAGILADCLGYRPTLVAAALLQASAITLQLVALTPLQLGLSGALLGIALALFTAAKTPQIALLVTKRSLPTALALSRGLASVGGALGGITAAWISHMTGEVDLALAAGALLIFLSALPLLFLPKGPALRFSAYSLFSQKNRSNLWSSMTISFFFCALGTSLVSPYLNLLLRAQGLPLPFVSISFSAWQMAALIAWPITSALSRISNPLPFSLAGLSLACYLASLPQGQTTWWLSLFVWQLYLCLSLNFYYSTFASIEQAQGLKFAFLGLLYTCGAIVGTRLGGKLLQESSRQLLLTAAGCIGIACLLATFGQVNYKSNKPQIPCS